MSRPLRVVGLVVLVSLLIAFLVHTRMRRRAGSAPEPAAGPVVEQGVKPLPFKSSFACIKCHEAIGKEWLESTHAHAWPHPALGLSDPGKTECSACHIPQPIHQTGLTNRVKVRALRHEEGVGCITCHVRHQLTLGSGPTRDAPCNPTHAPSMSTVEACRPCHAFHGTLDEWKKSKFSAQGIGCQSCHMPKVRRPLVKGGKPRDGHSHRMLGGRDPVLLAQALTVVAKIEGKRLVVTLTNDKVGHAVPGEISNRRIHLVMSFLDAAGNEVEEVFRTFKAPPRPKRKLVKTTQIQPGQTVRVVQPLPGKAVSVVVALEYRLFFLVPYRTFYRKVLRW